MQGSAALPAAGAQVPQAAGARCRCAGARRRQTADRSLGPPRSAAAGGSRLVAGGWDRTGRLAGRRGQATRHSHTAHCSTQRTRHTPQPHARPHTHAGAGAGSRPPTPGHGPLPLARLRHSRPTLTPPAAGGRETTDCAEVTLTSDVDGWGHTDHTPQLEAHSPQVNTELQRAERSSTAPRMRTARIPPDSRSAAAPSESLTK